MTLIPLWFTLVWLALLGAVLGSFLGVVSYRLHTGRSLDGNSHCESCMYRLRWYELVPVISYLALRGRCRMCGAYIPMRHVLIELLTASLFVVVGLTVPLTMPFVLLLGLLIVAVLVVILVYDLRHMIIPDELVIILSVLAIAMLIVTSTPIALLTHVIDGALGAVAASGFFLFLWFVTKGRGMGLGDAKLAAPLGLMTGLTGAISLVAFAFWIGAILSLTLIAGQHLKAVLRAARTVGSVGYAQANIANYQRYLTMKSEVPFAPFLILAFFVTYFGQLDVLMLANYVLTWFTF